jgi:NMD protein affecting ribosome stability and mRNA decay
MFKFCVKCGKKKSVFIKSFCKKCFLEDNKLLFFPERIELSWCRKCNKIKVQRQWIDFNSIELVDFIKSKIKSKDFVIQAIEVELEEIHEKQLNALIEVKGLMEGTALVLREVIKLIKVPGICDSCMKISSDYFEAVIQVRFKEKEEEKERKILAEFTSIISEMNKKDPLARIVKNIKNNKGFDLILSSNRTARIASEKIARKYNSKITKSFSVIGRNKTGKEKRRYTYCVRL